MKAKRKAEQLYRKFYGATMISGIKGVDKKRVAIASAMHCVDEMQEHAQMIDTPYEGYSNPYQFLLKVKEELSLL